MRVPSARASTANFDAAYTVLYGVATLPAPEDIIIILEHIDDEEDEEEMFHVRSRGKLAVIKRI